MERIKIGILGYGNLGKGVECAVKQNEDMELAAVFTRRNPQTVKILTSNVPVFSADVLDDGMKRPVFDVLIACGGSAADLPQQTPRYAEYYNIVDSYDNHNKAAEHFVRVDRAARRGRKLAVICAGWDPGIFSLSRVMAAAAFPQGENYTFWGSGVSQGHSDAVRKIEGVKDARQYTIPADEAVRMVRSGHMPVLEAGQKHVRECFVVAEEGADREKIRNEIVNMPDYFQGYTTAVHFISEEEMKEKHSTLHHAGMMIRPARTGWENSSNALYELRLRMDSNPEFCGCIMCAYARAAFRLNSEGHSGCRTVFDIPAGKTFYGSRRELFGML